MSIQVENLSLTVDGQPVLNGVTTTIESNTLTCLLGANGAGKTSLLRILLGETQPTSGRVVLGETELTGVRQRELARHLAAVPQDAGAPPYLTVSELVGLGRFRPDGGLWWRLDEEDRNVVAACLSRCGIEGLATRTVRSLSGGERQRAWVAFCLAQEKGFLVLDEALDALDFMTRRDFFHLLVSVAAEGRGVLLVTHDVGLAREFAGRIIVLSAGSVAYEGPAAVDLADLLARVRQPQAPA